MTWLGGACARADCGAGNRTRAGGLNNATRPRRAGAWRIVARLALAHQKAARIAQPVYQYRGRLVESWF